MKMVLKRYLSEKHRYKKIVFCECLFSGLRYDNLISKNVMNNNLYKDEKVIQVNEKMFKLMKMVPGTTEHDMGCWRRFRTTTF